MLHRILTFSLLASTALFGQKPLREVLELQRDVAQLQEEVRTLRTGLEQRVGAATTQMQTMTDSMTQLSASVGAVQKGLTQIAQDQDRKLTPLVAEQGSRLEQLSGSFSTIQQALTDLTSAINRLQTQMVDLGNAVKVLQAPPAAPKPPSAEELLRTADTDRLAGKYELAAQGYADFLKNFADSPQADVAQFQLGTAHYQMKDMESAAKDFDLFVQTYPKSARLPEALFYKAKSLQALERAPEAAAVCRELKAKFPRNEFVAQCAPARK